MDPQRNEDNDNNVQFEHGENNETKMDAEAIAQCPFCCKGFMSDKFLLEHVKTNSCKARVAKKKDLSGTVTALLSRVDRLENVIVTLEKRIDAMARNEVILLDRIRATKATEIPKEDDQTTEVQQNVEFPPNGTSSIPYDRCSISHIATAELAKCVREYEYSGIRRMTKLIYFNQVAPKNKSIIVTKGRSMTVYICTEDGQWDLHSKASALKRICRQVLCYMSAKLDDEDFQIDLKQLYGIHKTKLEQVITDIDECINDASGKTHRKFYDDVWCLLASSI